MRHRASVNRVRLSKRKPRQIGARVISRPRRVLRSVAFAGTVVLAVVAGCNRTVGGLPPDQVNVDRVYESPSGNDVWRARTRDGRTTNFTTAPYRRTGGTRR